jgi:hypothetical protein
VAAVSLPQFEVLVIMAGIVGIAAAIITSPPEAVSVSSEHQDAARPSSGPAPRKEHAAASDIERIPSRRHPQTTITRHKPVMGAGQGR